MVSMMNLARCCMSACSVRAGPSWLVNGGGSSRLRTALQMQCLVSRDIGVLARSLASFLGLTCDDVEFEFVFVRQASYGAFAGCVVFDVVCHLT